MAISILEVTTSAGVPSFAPFGVLYYAQDSGELWIGTGFSTGSDFAAGNPGPNINKELIASPGGSPGGFSGDIQYNNAGVLGGSAATVSAAGAIVALSLASTTVTSTTFDFLGALTDNVASTGASGNVLTAGTGGQVMWAASSSIGIPWSSLTNATANLSLSNAGYTTTFNQTSNVAWLWANTTTGTSGTTNASPLLEVAANYYTGSTSAQDLWTIGSSLAAGTNGASTLTFTHSGSTGTALISTNGSFSVPTTTGFGYFFGTPSGDVGMVYSVSYGIGFLFTGVTPTISLTSNQFTSNASVNILASASVLRWSTDTGLSRISAGVVGVGTGAATSTAGTLQAANTQVLKRLSFTANSDVTGTITGITTTAAKAYAVNYTSVPMVVVTPTTVCSTFYVSSSTAGGYVVSYGPSQGAVFNTIVMGNPT